MTENRKLWQYGAYRKSSASKVRPVIYKMSDPQEREALQSLMLGLEVKGHFRVGKKGLFSVGLKAAIRV